MSCHSSWSARLPSSAWRWHVVLPPRGELPVGEWGLPSPSEGGDCCLEWSPPATAIYASMWCSKGAMTRMAIGSSLSSVAFMAPHDAHCISSVMWNGATDSVAEYWGTPKGWACPSVTQISKMSSSNTEVASNRVLSFLVTINMHILALRWGVVGWNLISAQGSGWGWGRHFWFWMKGHNDAFCFFWVQENAVSCHNFLQSIWLKT